jgi:hypothetical protein
VKEARRFVRPEKEGPREGRPDAQVNIAVPRQRRGDLLNPVRDGSGHVEAVLDLKARGLQDRACTFEPGRHDGLFG